MHALVSAGGGFLLAVLWFDLMFDVQLLHHKESARSRDAVTSIAGYYRRVTTDSRPMNRLVAVVMTVTAGAIVAELVRGAAPTWAWWASFFLAGIPFSLAGTRTVPTAVRLGMQGDTHEQQHSLARSILYDHLFCVACIAGLLVVQLGWV